jgi:hypothetical protein
MTAVGRSSKTDTADTRASTGTSSPQAAVDAAAWWRDLAVVMVILGVTILAWCTANDMWSMAAWSLPTIYLDPVYSDFVGTCSYLKAMATGDFLPFGWKLLPDIGAPQGANWTTTPTPDELLLGFFGLLAKIFGLFTGFNIGVLLGHLAAATAFYFVARTEGASNPWAGVGALAFGLAPYLFAESPHHVNCLYAWHIPLFVPVWRWMATEHGAPFRSHRFWLAIGVGVLTGLQNPYYTFVFCQLALLGAAFVAWRTRSSAALAPALAVIGAAAIAFAVSNLDTFSYRLLHNVANAPFITQREYRWMDIYGFKLVDLFIPYIRHHSDALAKFGLAHRQASVLNDEEGCAYLGMIGIACLLWLVAVSIRAMAERRESAVPLAAWQVLWIVIMFNTGGLNSIIAAFTGFTLFRTACRYSIVVLAIVLLWAARRLTAWQQDDGKRLPPDTLQIATSTAAAGLCLLVLWDQVPRAPAPEQVATIARQVAADRDFVAAMESALPAKGMVFQLPVMDGSPLPGVPSSDHYRPYLYSHGLRFTMGATKGSESEVWQQAVQKQLLAGATLNQQTQQIQFNQNSVAAAVDELRKQGFAAIYVNRNGFPDRGKGLEKSLLELGSLKPPIDSAAGDLVCIPLEKN